MHLDFMVIPFGLNNALAIFMFLMNSVLHKFLDKFMVDFIDHILFYSKNEQEHEEHLKMVLQALREHKLYPKFTIAIFYQDKF